MRAEGYYRVKFEGAWIVALYHDNNNSIDDSDWCWRSHRIDGKGDDSDFSEINETRIPMPDEAVGIEKILSELSVIARDAIDSDGFFSSSEFEEYAGELIFAKILKH